MLQNEVLEASPLKVEAGIETARRAANTQEDRMVRKTFLKRLVFRVKRGTRG